MVLAAVRRDNDKHSLTQQHHHFPRDDFEGKSRFGLDCVIARPDSAPNTYNNLKCLDE